MQISVALCDANLNSPFLSIIVFVCLFRYEALKDNEIIPVLLLALNQSYKVKIVMMRNQLFLTMKYQLYL